MLEASMAYDFIGQIKQLTLPAMSTIEILTGVLTAITAVYAALTYGILRSNRRVVTEMQAEREAVTRPYVSIAPLLLPRSSVLSLRIKNTGKTAATDLRLEIDRPFFRHGRQEPTQNLATFAAFREPIETFAPGNQLVFALGSAVALYGEAAKPELTPLVFHVRASYSFAGKRVEEHTIVDLRPYLGSDVIHDATVDALHAIKDVLKQLK
jgi:hypothetical protein